LINIGVLFPLIKQKKLVFKTKIRETKSCYLYLSTREIVQNLKLQNIKNKMSKGLHILKVILINTIIEVVLGQDGELSGFHCAFLSSLSKECDKVK